MSAEKHQWTTSVFRFKRFCCCCCFFNPVYYPHQADRAGKHPLGLVSINTFPPKWYLGKNHTSVCSSVKRRCLWISSRNKMVEFCFNFFPLWLFLPSYKESLNGNFIYDFSIFTDLNTFIMVVANWWRSVFFFFPLCVLVILWGCSIPTGWVVLHSYFRSLFFIIEIHKS